MGEPKAYVATTGKKIEARDQRIFSELLSETYGEDYDLILGQGLFLDAQKENKDGRDAVYGFYRRIMDLERSIIGEDPKPSCFAGEAKKAKKKLQQSFSKFLTFLAKNYVLYIIN